MQRLCAVCVFANSLCAFWTVPLSFSILKKNAHSTEVKETVNTKVGGWDFRPPSLNAKTLIKDSEFNFNVCIYASNFGGAGSWEGVFFHIQVM